MTTTTSGAGAGGSGEGGVVQRLGKGATDDEEEEDVLDVIIIGAGLAGLSAGRKLLEAQQQQLRKEQKAPVAATSDGGGNVPRFIILEGRDEIGGRCRTITLKDGKSLAELGAQWIHDSHEGNVMTRLTKESGVVTKACDRKSGILYIMMQHQNDGDDEGEQEKHNKPDNQYEYRTVSVEEFRTNHQQWMNSFLKYQENQKEKSDEVDISLEECLHQFILEKQHRGSCCFNQDPMSEEEVAWLNYFMDSEIVQEYAASLDQLSLLHWDDDEIDDQDEHVDLHLAQDVRRGGYKAVLEYLARPLLEEKDDFNKIIRCNCKVTTIDWKNNSDDAFNQDNNLVKVYYKDTSNQSKVQGEERCLMARKVLLTVPLGILKAKTIAFQPELPESKQLIIDKIGYGCLNKCILLWDENDIDMLPWPMDKEWVERIVVPVQQQQQGSKDEEQQQQQGIWTEFYNCYPMNQRPMLIGFLAGENAAQMEESYADEQIQRQVLQALREWFGGVGSTTSSSSSGTNTIPDPIQVVVTRWNQDEFSFGSYSYNAVGGKHRYRNRLADPVGGCLYFAGEACHAKYPSTTQGAYLSGQSTAEVLLKDLKNNKQ